MLNRSSSLDSSISKVPLRKMQARGIGGTSCTFRKSGSPLGTSYMWLPNCEILGTPWFQNLEESHFHRINVDQIHMDIAFVKNLNPSSQLKVTFI